jgi:hypothetical protein
MGSHPNTFANNPKGFYTFSKAFSNIDPSTIYSQDYIQIPFLPITLLPLYY